MDGCFYVYMIHIVIFRCEYTSYYDVGFFDVKAPHQLDTCQF